MGVYLIDLNEKRTFIMKKAENNLTRLLTTAKGNSTTEKYKHICLLNAISAL